MLKAQWRRTALIAGGVAAVLALGLVILTLAFMGNLSASAPTPATAPATAEPTPEPTPEAAEAPEPTTTGVRQTEEVNTSEPLEMTLDEFGVATRYDDRFTLGGQIWDQSYFEGEIFVANMYATHDHDFKSQEGCVVVYYRAPEGGSRIRFTGWNGQGFELNANSGISLNQAIAAMRETLVRAHGCEADEVQYHQAIRHGDPVK